MQKLAGQRDVQIWGRARLQTRDEPRRPGDEAATTPVVQGPVENACQLGERGRASDVGVVGHSRGGKDS